MTPRTSIFADTRPLQTPAYRRLFAAQVVTVIGSQLTVVAVPQQIYEITRSSAYVGLAGVFALVPLVAFGLWGGALADALDRRKVLLGTTVGLICTMLALFAQAAAGNRNVWVVLVLLSVQQAFFAVNQPTRTAVLPRILRADELAAANALNMTVLQFGSVAGPLLAGVLIPWLGLPVLYLCDAVFLVTTLWAVLRLPPIPPGERAPTPGIRAVVEGFVFLGTQRVLLASFVVDIVAMVFGMTRALFPQIAHETFGDPPEGGIALGVLYAAMSLGAVLGGVLSGWVSRVRRQGAAVLGAIAVWGVSVAGFGAVIWCAGRADGETHHWWLAAAVAALALGGWADMVSAALRQTILLSAATDEMRGRLQGVFTVVVAGGPRVGDALQGAAASVVGPAFSAMAGGALVLGGIATSAARFRRFRGYEAVGESVRERPVDTGTDKEL